MPREGDSGRLVVVSSRTASSFAPEAAGGLDGAVASLMRARGGFWAGCNIRPPRVANVDDQAASHGRVSIELAAAEQNGFSTQFADGFLWPLLHTMPEAMRYDRASGAIYRSVNGRLARALRPHLRAGDTIWVHGHHFIPLAACLRAIGVANPIAFSLLVPFPARDVFLTAPGAHGLIDDLSQADLLGFQTAADMENFSATAASLRRGVHCPDAGTLAIGSRLVRLGVFPLAIDARRVARVAGRVVQAPAMRHLAGSLAGQALILGIDRLERTQGLVQRLQGLRTLLEGSDSWRGRVTLLQIACASSRKGGQDGALRCEVSEQAGRLNADLGNPAWQPVRLVGSACRRAEAAGYLRLARVGLATPLRDGANLMAKAFVAAQDPADPGVLVLSRCAAAAGQLGGAVPVNPHDHASIAEGLDQALRMGLEERRRRWQAMWNAIADTSPLAWARAVLAAMPPVRPSDAPNPVLPSPLVHARGPAMAEPTPQAPAHGRKAGAVVARGG